MNAPNQAFSIDEKTIAAKYSNDQFERLIAEFTPFLRRHLAKYSVYVHSAHQREDMFSIILSAFYEAVQAFDAQKGRFIPFANRVICVRMIDHLRKIYRYEKMTAYIEEEGTAYSARHTAISEVSIRRYEEERRNELLAEEIEQFEAELNTWGITIEELAGRSPKHVKLRETCRDVVLTIAQDPEMTQIIRKKRRLPIGVISEVTGVPYKKLERLRIYLLAAFIAKTGDYKFISGYM